MIKLNVPLLSQRDPRWAGQRLGTIDGTTIGSAGCIVTCMSMLATYYGHAITPDQMDNWLTDNQGYVQGNLYRNDAFPREFSDCTFDSVIFCTATPAPLDKIDGSLQLGKPVVVMVDFDHDPNDGIQTHFVLIVGRDDQGNYLINDPWYGDQVYLIARYGDNQSQAINQINLFSGNVPIQDPMVTIPQSEFDQLRSDRDKNWNLYQQEMQTNAALTSQLAALQKEFDDYKVSHSTVTYPAPPSTGTGPTPGTSTTTLPVPPTNSTGPGISPNASFLTFLKRIWRIIVYGTANTDA